MLGYFYEEYIKLNLDIDIYLDRLQLTRQKN